MALNLASFHPPALSTSDLHRTERRFREIQHGYEVVPLEMPALRASDGRQDFPHFWLYPLTTVPALWITEALSLHPNTAFTATNLLLAVLAFAMLVWRGLTPVALMVLAGPLLWWIDKAHADVFTVSLLTIGFVLLHGSPGWALVALGAAAAQNPPLAPVFILAAASVAVGLYTRRARADDFAARQAWIGLASGSALAMIPFLYYLWRLGILTPLAGWTRPHLPTVGEMGTFLWDPNIGLMLNHPVFVVSMGIALMAAVRTRRLGTWNTWLPLACALLLLAGFSQSVNINHGATPGMNRWTLWLVALGAPLLAEASTSLRGSRWMGIAAMASLVWSIYWFQPSRPENYKTATPTAQWIWSRVPWLNNPPVEIFAERVSHAEPPTVPVALPDCRKVLIVEGRWPAPCLPPVLEGASCTGPGTACYANASEDGYRLTRIAMPGGLHVERNPRAWPMDRSLTQHLREVIDQAGASGLAPAPAGLDGSMLRAAHGAAWTYALQARDRLVIYVGDPAPDAVLTLRLPGSMAGRFVDLDNGTTLSTVVRAGGEPWAAWDVKIPGGRPHVVLTMALAR
jgi:hypothetical protein